MNKLLTTLFALAVASVTAYAQTSAAPAQQKAPVAASADNKPAAGGAKSIESKVAMATSLALLPIAPIGVMIGVKVAHRIQPLLFYRLIYAGMFLTGCKLVWDGFIK